MSNRPMVPETAFSNVVDPHKIYVYPSYTYKLYIDEERIRGHTDYTNSVAQASDLVLHIDRNWADIYSDRYGIQVSDLYGKKTTYVKAKLEYRILDALSVDDRILDVYDYRSDIFDHGRKIKVSFTIVSTEGTFDYESVLNLFGDIDIDINLETFEEYFYYTYDEEGNPIIPEVEEPEPIPEPEPVPEPIPEPILDPVNDTKNRLVPFQTDRANSVQELVDNNTNRLNTNTNINVNQSFFNLVNSERKSLNINSIRN